MSDIEWPTLYAGEAALIVSLPIVSLVLAVVWLRWLWPVAASSKEEAKPLLLADPRRPRFAADQDMEALRAPQQVLEAGQVNVDADHEYLTHWTRTFDLVFLVFMACLLAVLVVWTHASRPDLWTNGKFWLLQTPKVGLMMVTSLLGGMFCRRYCDINERGYCFSRDDSWFKINYTRKLQHFAAYTVPLIVPAMEGCKGPMFLLWGDFFTMLGFLIMIKPLRERFTFSMLQFNALDRPEDRPNTLKWILAGNILPGLCLIVLFRYLLENVVGADPVLALIFIFITGIGDGFAEPVGIAWGAHKYKTRAFEARFCRDLNDKELELLAGEKPPAPFLSIKKYTRSYEGSVCVFLSAVVFTAAFYAHFANATQFWMCMLLMPLPMTLAEAWSPHTMDTPFLMTTGGLILVFVSYFF